jgi:Opioid growth factor receptor (OGFr) conserved region
MRHWESDPAVSFYSGGRDSEGRTLEEILAWDDERLEAVHDYIQWLFPTRRPSGVNLFAPLVSDDTARAFEQNPSLRAGLGRALDRMLTFYGLRWNGERIEIDTPRFSARAKVWLHPGNHNHLRLTRMMDSLATLGLRQEAAALQRCLIEDVAAGEGRGRVSPRTISFWQQAF